MAETDKDDLISIIDDDEFDEDLPTTMPLMPVRDVVIFTDMLMPLFVGRDKSINAVETAVEKDSIMMLSTQKEPGIENPTPDDIYTVGTVGRILRMLKLPDGRVKALVQGVAKAKIKKYVRKRASYRVNVEIIVEEPVKTISVKTEALMRNVREQSEKILVLKGELTNEIGAILESIEDPGKLADLVASNLKMRIEDAQNLLETFDPLKRLQKINDILSKEVELSSMQAKIQSDVRDEISKSQRDYFLREQVRAIHRELGESDEKAQEVKEYKAKIKKARMPEKVKEEAGKQLKRLEQMHPESAESSVVRTYLDWLVELPWSKSSQGGIDIARAKEVLDKNHYGLSKIKDRILEYLSVKKLNPKMKGPILCFVGPPGVGKTSLGQAIARAMKRKYVRISLGGIRDEAEIRGHRRTYIGALPGRIIQGLKQSGTNNPIFMMDEIDKLGADFRGDPSSALLEALDPEQNSEFSDHYLNLPFDLSGVIFILTANMTDTIPSALLDRMEIISLSGYTLEEKEKIATAFLIPRQVKENGIKQNRLSISSGALRTIINEYTLEAGLRNLERTIGAICRKIARKIAEGGKGKFAVTRINLHKYLGPPEYVQEMDKETSQVGLSTGLAWTPVGGEALYIEATLIGGKGDLIVTGQLGEVMQESARAALSYTRANLKKYKIKENLLENVDIHIHVPAGATPKDGPSAGIAMAAAIISVLTDTPVNKDVAMTGEITLRGRVLPIGGLKEKALGALRAGIRTIVLPEKNKRDLVKIPPNVKRKIRFIPVKNMDEVVPLALEKGKKRATAGKRKKAGSGLKLLAVDTATTSCSVALAGPEGTLAELNFFGGQTHSKHLAAMVHALLETAAARINEVDAFAVCSGPGTFTGLRIGMAAVKGLAAAGGKPVVGVSSLDVLAGQAGFTPGAVCPMIDARREEVYTALYQVQAGGLVKMSGEQVIAPRKMLDTIDRPCLFIGSGAVVYREMILDSTHHTACFADQTMHHPRAATVARLGLEKLETGEGCNAADLLPRYLRRSDAEKNR